METFFRTLRKVISPQYLKTTAPSANVVSVLTEFREQVLMDVLEKQKIPENTTILLKHPLTAFVLPELCEVFDVKILGVLRPINDIESTRSRRQWPPRFGAKGALAIYSHLFAHITNTTTPFMLTRYSDMTHNPRAFLDQIAPFIGITPSQRQCQSACDFITNRP